MPARPGLSQFKNTPDTHSKKDSSALQGFPQGMELARLIVRND
jgi:hypothetical protein